MSNKTSDKNVANVTKSDIDILNALIYVYEARLPNYNELMDSEVKSLKNILADYTRQKKINEEHKKLNGELRERVKELEEIVNCCNIVKNATLSNDIVVMLKSDFIRNYEQIYIPKQVVIDRIKELKLSGGSNGKDNVENLVRELAIDILQELLGGEK